LCKDKKHSLLASRLYYGRGRAYYSAAKLVGESAREYDEAISSLSKAVHLNQSDADAYILRGSSYMMQGQIESAMKDCEKAIELAPDNPYPYSTLGDANRALFDYDQAILFYNKAISINAQNAAFYIQMGSVYHNLGKYEQAIENCNISLKLAPAKADSHFLYGLACESMYDYDTALQHYETALTFQPDRIDAYIKQGYILLDQGHLGQAINAFSRANSLNPKSKAYAGCLRAYQILGDEEKAKQARRKLDNYLEQITQSQNENGNEYLDLGWAYHFIGRHAIAVKLLSYAIQLKPTFIWINGYFYRSRAFLFLGDLPKAIEDQKKVIDLHRSSINAGVYTDLAILQHLLGANDEAMFSLNIAIEIDADFIDAYYIRGNLFYDLDNHQNAQEDFAKAMALEAEKFYEYKPALNDIHGFYERGLARARTGNRSGAIADLEKTVHLCRWYHYPRLQQQAETVLADMVA
jgi:tetratricopeptide (TPR) repeat protein